MTYNANIHHRHSIRLQEYDYSLEGLYFITICTHERSPLFGHISNDQMYTNKLGKVVEGE